jgi:RND family efflux transporter MFP subunit
MLFGLIFVLLILSLAPATTAVAEDAKPVSTIALEELALQPNKDAPATVVSLNDARVSAEANGVLKTLSVNVGDRVAQGDVLGTLACDEYEIAEKGARARLKAAKARLDFARSQLASAKKLSSIKSIAQEEVDERNAEFAVASAEIDIAESALRNAERLSGHCEIRAPFTGVVVERLASIGDFATTGTPIFRLLDTENIEISAFVQQQDLQSLREATAPMFRFQGMDFPLKLRTVLPLIESKTRSQEVRMRFSSQSAPPGGTGRLSWTIDRFHLPPTILVRRQNQLGIFTEQNNIALFRPMNAAIPGQPVLIEADLAANTRVITEGRFSLEDGDPVRVVNSQ